LTIRGAEFRGVLLLPVDEFLRTDTHLRTEQPDPYEAEDAQQRDRRDDNTENLQLFPEPLLLGIDSVHKTFQAAGRGDHPEFLVDVSHPLPSAGVHMSDFNQYRQNHVVQDLSLREKRLPVVLLRWPGAG